jgi:hypothetical protein
MPNPQQNIDGAFTAGGLLYRETIAVIPLLGQDNFKELLMEEVKRNEYVKIRSEAARTRSLREIRKRFINAGKDLRKDFQNQSEKEQRLTLLYLCMKTYPLVFDLHFEVTIPKINALGSLPENYHYLSRIDTIAQRQEDSVINTESTRKKLVTVYKRMLNEAGIISKERPMTVFVPESFWCTFLQQNDSWFVEACFMNLDQLNTMKENC